MAQSRDLEARLGRALSSWVMGVGARPRSVAVAFLIATLGSLVFAATHLAIQADQERLFNQELPFRVAESRYRAAFPSNFDNLFVVIDAATPERASAAAKQLAQRLREDERNFRSVYLPGGGEFFERHAFLYLDTEDLDALVDRLAEAQPYLAALSREPSVRNFASLLARGLHAVRDGDFPGDQLEAVMDRFSLALEGALEGRLEPLSWAEIFAGQRVEEDLRRRFLLLRPTLKPNEVIAGGDAIQAVRDAIHAQGLGGASGVRVRITGDYALSVEEMDVVSSQAASAGVASLAAVTVILLLALRSGRLVVSIVTSLLAGLIMTAAFTGVAIGHFNLISVAFAVLFIGLGVDFGIHFCVGYRERLAGGSHDDALRGTAGDVGTSLVLCATTTALGFFAFVPTDFRGVAELGLISGAGMFISLFCMVTLLPALISLWPLTGSASPTSRGWEMKLLDLPIRHPRVVRAGALILAAASVLVLPKARFDNNPLNVRDPSSEAVRTFSELIEEGPTPWSLNAIAPDLASAEALARRVEALVEVDRVLTVSDYVPTDQEEKLAIIDDLALFLDLPEEVADLPAANERADREALAHLLEEVHKLERAQPGGPLAETLPRFASALSAFLATTDESNGSAEPALDTLEESLLGSLPEQLRTLDAALDAGRVTLSSLPDVLLERMVSDDGQVRIEIFPRDDIRDNAAMAEFVDAVRVLIPDVAGSANEIVESGRTVVAALRQALLSALVAIAVLVWLLWRRLDDTALVMIPLGLASSFTVATAVALDIPFNFADVIVLPLLLGIGVDSSIHLVHRARRAQAQGSSGNLLATSTARAVAYSALTTIASFGTLGFAGHQGLATLGQLLTIGVGHTLICTLVVLPVLVMRRGDA